MVAVDEVLVHVRITVLQLGVLLFLSAWPLTECDEHTSPPEVVIPLRITGRNGDMRPLGWLSYSLDFGGQRRIIHMKARKFLVLSRHLVTFTYTDQGALVADWPFVQHDCYYVGFVEGAPESIVALTTCFGGFQGSLLINDAAYVIKPKSLSSTFEHLVYRMDSEETELLPMRCGLTEEEITRQMNIRQSFNFTVMQSNYKRWWTNKWNVDLVLVVDHKRFLYLESNITYVMQDVFIVMNEVNFIFFPVDVNVVLFGLEIWNEWNPMPVEDIYNLLSDFCKWKRTHLNSHIPHDIVHLFVQHNFRNYFGLAYVGTMCNTTFGCGVDSFLGEDFFGFKYVVAHEIGHNLGMPHDRRPCTCERESCIMAATKSRSRKFSNCSYGMLRTTATKTRCMHSVLNPLDKARRTFCGNGVVEEGEECDCGSPEMCEKNPCCLQNCTLKYGAICDAGLCCNKCHFQPPGTVCRFKNNECDLTEWCDGTSGECPEDVFLQNGYPCKSGGYCYENQCNKHDEQCQDIFGEEAKSGSKICYQKINTRGDRFGNCGIKGKTYVKCKDSDVFCGRVQCTNVKKIPLLKNRYSVHNSHFNGVTCWSTDYPRGMTTPDIGEVKNGTHCGPQRICMNNRCIHKSVWVSECSQKTCNMKGVCNNKHHCHCRFGWAPPNCLEKGTGGSIDSGPTPKRGRMKKLKQRAMGLTFWGFFLDVGPLFVILAL